MRRSESETFKTFNKCWCFNDKEELANEYREYMYNIDEKHLGDNTVNTIVYWLADRNVKTFELIPFFAQNDYEELICLNNKKAKFLSYENKYINRACDMIRIKGNEQQRLILNAIKEIAIKCKCED